MKHSDSAPGWILRRFRKIEKQIRELSSARRLEAATIGKGGVKVKDGGFIRTFYPATLGGGEIVGLGFLGTDFTTGTGDNYSLGFKDEDGNFKFVVYRIPPSVDFPSGASGVNADAEVIYLTTGTGTFQLDTTGGQISHTGALALNASGGTSIQHSTTGASANCFIDPSGGRIWRSTSSRRYKQDFEDADVDPAAVLKMQPRTWRDKAEVEADPDTERRYIGFIAEELDELGLGQFVEYDDEGPEAIAYDRLSVALLAVLKDQDERLRALESAHEAAADAEEPDEPDGSGEDE